MEIQRLGKSNLMGDDLYVKRGNQFNKMELHWHEYFELIYYYDCSVRCNVNGDNIYMKSGDLYFLTPFDFHKTENLRQDGSIAFINVSFSSDFLDKDVSEKIGSAYYIKGEKLDNKILTLLEMVENKDGMLSRGNIKRILNVLVALITRIGDPIAISKDFSYRSDMLRKVFEYISSNFAREINLSDVAEYFHLTPSYFSSWFSTNAGCTFIQYLTTFRLKFAKQLLQSTDLSVTQICFDCGFTSLSHFLRVFKKHYGVSPSKLRKN